jgi:hypothetical protein
MPITYVRLVYTKPAPDVFEWRFDNLEEDNILLIDPVLEATSDSIGTLYRETFARFLRRHDVVVFRGGGPEFVNTVATDVVVGDVVKQLRGGALVSRAGEMKSPTWMPIPGMEDPARVPDLKALRQAEVEGILKRTGAIYETDVYHYVLPYQERHAEKFIRLADALRSVYDIDRILDWLVEAITGDTLIIGDTGSMLPLMVRLREHSQRVAGHVIEIATLDKYPEDRVDVTARIRAITNRPFVTDAEDREKPLNYLFLISVSSSGRLCQLFHNMIPDSTIIVLCRTTADELPCKQDLATVEIQNWPAAACEKCATHPRIYVDPQTYELIPHLDWKAVIVGQTKAKEKAKFWSMVSRRDAVELHKTIEYSGTAPKSERHFSVFLDTARMAEDKWFREKCLEALRSLGRPEPPDLILIPQHKNSHVVAAICKEVFEKLTPLTVPAGKIEESLNGPLQGAKRILIADDAIVTGETLFNFRSAIYKITQPAGARPSISIFVMVSRTANDVLLESLERRYRDHEGVRIAYGEKIFLPEEQHCPWCKERDFLRSIVRLLPEDEEVRESVRLRIEQLTQTPLQWPFFMLPADHGLEPNLKAVDSFFGTVEEPLNIRAAFAAGACVAQTMKMELGNSSRAPKKTQKPKREGRIRRLARQWWVLERLYLAGRILFGYSPTGDGIEFKYADLRMVYDSFFETTLLSSLLRTFDGVEVRHPGIDEKFKVKLEVADPVRTYPGAVTELAYAAISGKVPKQTVRATLEKFQGTDRWFRMLLAIMNAVEAK